MREIIHYEQRTCDKCGRQAKYDLATKRYGVFDQFPGWVEVIERSVSTRLGRTHISRDYCSVKCHIDSMLVTAITQGTNKAQAEEIK